ncbi:MAG: ferritin family protein [Chloroflexota bacterium]
MRGESEVLVALRKYIDNEQDGYDFYQQCAERTADQRGREMFLSLAKDELEHIRKLEIEYRSLHDQGDWLSLRELDSRAEEPARGIFPKDKRQVRQMVKPDATDLDALLIAIQMEKESFSAYDEERRRAKSEAAREVFAQLAEEEHRHLETLENTHEYLANTGSWFQVLEKPIFEG